MISNSGRKLNNKNQTLLLQTVILLSIHRNRIIVIEEEELCIFTTSVLVESNIHGNTKSLPCLSCFHGLYRSKSNFIRENYIVSQNSETLILHFTFLEV